jgi:hypothetical protein
MHPDKSILLQIVKQISSIFEITDLGPVAKYLNIDIIQNESGIFLHQSAYTQEILQKFMDTSCMKVVSIPLTAGYSLVKTEGVNALLKDQYTSYDPKQYASLIGSLMYLATISRPDISHAISQLCCYMAKPSIAHWKAAQSVLYYLNTTSDYGLWFKANPENDSLIGYCDASYNSDIDTRRSYTGYCFKFYDSLISWQSKLQPCVALSTTQSEYMAISAAGREGVWLRRLVAEIISDYIFIPMNVGAATIQLKFDTTSKNQDDILSAQIIYSDSTSAIALVKNNYTSKDTKHIDKVHHWAREQVELKRLNYQYIKTSDNISDIFTKNLDRIKFTKFRDQLGVHSITSFTSSIVE